VRTRSLAAAAVLTGLLLGCTTEPEPDPGATTTPPTTVSLEKQAIVAYADLAHAQYAEALNQAIGLNLTIDRFLDAPTATTLAAAQKAWRDSRPPYLRTEAFRFYGGPIDDPDNGREGFINAWPLDEAYIDYVEGDPTAGIINKPSLVPTLTAETIADQNEKGGETNIATGYHAIEFLLWGQDTDPAAAGKRPHTDYTPRGPRNADRRRQYLAIVGDLLVADLKSVVDAWDPKTGPYRTEFINTDPKEGLRRILTGIGTLSGGELAGERLNVPYESKDFEDEHSCFSDNTTVDHIEDARGILQVWERVLQPVVKAKSATLAAAFDKDVKASVAAAEAIPAPFDQAILGSDDAPGRKAILATIKALEAQTATTVKIAEALELKINTSV
jgi:putative iron-regulated protein